MTTPQDTEPPDIPVPIPIRVSRNSNDIEELYEITKATNETVGTIAAVQQVHGNRLVDIGRTLDVHTNRLNKISGRLNHIETTLHGHTETLDAHGRKLDDHSRKLDDHGKKLDDHGRKLDDHGRKLDTIIDLLSAK